MADNDININVNVETKDAQKSLDQLDSKASETSSSMSGAFKAIGVAAAAALAFAASKEIVGFFADGISAAQDQEKAMASLGQQLKLTGSFSKEALDDFASFADEMERTSTFGDDLVVSQLAVAKSFGVSNSGAKELVKAATDLSAVTGQSLETSVKQLGLTLAGTTGKLDEQIPALRGLTKEQLAAGEAIKIVQDRFQGSALAQVDTFGGAIIQLGNSFSNLKESIGAVIVANPSLIAAFKSLSGIFFELQGFVEDNKDAIADFITFGVRAIATAVPVAIEVLGFFIRAFEGLVLAGSLAFTGLLEVVGVFVKVWDKTIGNAARGLFTLYEALGGSEDVRKNFDEFIGGALTGIDDLANGAAEFTANTAGKFEKFNAGFATFQTKIDGVAQGIFDADAKISTSSRKTADDIKKDKEATARVAVKSAEDVKKAAADAAAFEKQIREATLTDEQKIVAKREENLTKLNELVKSGAVGVKKAADLRVQIESDTVTKLEALAKKNSDTAIEQSKKAADEQKAIAEKSAADQKKIADDLRASISAIAANPIKLAVDAAGIQPANISEGTAKGIAAGAGVVDKALSGAAGAKSLVSEGAGLIADAFLPGIGGTVASIVGKLAEGPEATKQFIKDFAEGIPTIITAVAESIPVVVDALIEYLINKGGAVKIAVAIVKGMVTAIGGVGRVLAGAIGEGVAMIGPALSLAFTEGTAKIAQVITNIPAAFVQGGQAVFAGISQAFTIYIDTLRSFYTEVADILLAVFNIPIEAFKSIIGNFQFPSIKLPPVFNTFINAISNLFKTPPWISFLVEIANFFGEIFGPIADALSGGGGGGGFLGLATGIKEVPKGFPNDTFPAGLTSGERVVPVDTNRDLTDFLEAPDTGDGGNDSQQMATVIALLGQIASGIQSGGGGTSEITLKIDGRTLAKELVNIDRRNLRTTA